MPRGELVLLVQKNVTHVIWFLLVTSPRPVNVKFHVRALNRYSGASGVKARASVVTTSKLRALESHTNHTNAHMRPEEATIHVAQRLYDKRIRGALHYHIAAAFDRNTLLCSAINVPGMHAEMCVLRRLEHYATRHRVNWSRVCIVVVRWSSGESFHMSTVL